MSLIPALESKKVTKNKKRDRKQFKTMRHNIKNVKVQSTKAEA